MPMTRAYKEIIDFIAAGTSPRDVVAFQPSEAPKALVTDLIHREKTTGLSPEETTESHTGTTVPRIYALARSTG